MTDNTADAIRMHLSEDQRLRFNKLSDDIIIFMCEIGNPYLELRADMSSCEIVSAEISYFTNEHIKD